MASITCFQCGYNDSSNYKGLFVGDVFKTVKPYDLNGEIVIVCEYCNLVPKGAILLNLKSNDDRLQKWIDETAECVGCDSASKSILCCWNGNEGVNCRSCYDDDECDSD